MPKQDFDRCVGYIPPSRLAGLPPSTPVLLAFSGGADSCALLHLLYRSSLEDGFPLLLAHINHGIRGEEALRDREFCRVQAAAYGLEICVLDCDVPALARRNGRGLEEEARQARYAYLEELMRERKIPLLVTAHHADDQLETVLFRICRGTGLRGLGGIAPTRRFSDGVLVRPLLHCTKRQIEAYCKAHSLPYVTDSTNADLAYARNRIRGEVIPTLETLFDGLQLRVAQMSESLREDEDCLQQLAQDFLKTATTSEGLDVDALRVLPIALKKRVLHTWVMSCTGSSLERTHLHALLALAEQPCEGQTRVALPDSFCAIRELGRLQLRPDREKPPVPFCVPLTVGETDFCDGEIRVCVEPLDENTKIHNLSTEKRIISYTVFDIIKKDVYWRLRREGDTLLMGGHRRKLRKLYNAQGIPTRLRDRLPLLCDGEGIVLAPFVGCRDGLADAGVPYVVRIMLQEKSI